MLVVYMIQTGESLETVVKALLEGKKITKGKYSYEYS
jgi:hypothetical protein